MATLTRTALQLNAAVGIACVVAAGALMSLMLSAPERIAAAVAKDDYGSIAAAVGSELLRWLHALVHFL